MRNYVSLLMGMALAFLFVFTSCSKDETILPNQDQTTEADNARRVSGPSIVNFVRDNPDFQVLYQAILRVNSVETILSGRVPVTVFAPTDDAFMDLLNAAGFSSLNAVPLDVLKTILTGHIIVNDVLTAADLSTGYYETIGSTPFGVQAPASIYISTANGVTINGTADVIAADVTVGSGIIHVIDAVINPGNIVGFAVNDPNFSSLVAALTRPDLSVDFVGALSQPGPFTVLAPTNQAFQNLLNSNPAWNSLNDIPAGLLEQVLLYHVTADGNVRSGQLFDGLTATSLQGSNWYFDLDNGVQIIAGSNTANVIATDVQGQNGVIHAIDAVILP